LIYNPNFFVFTGAPGVGKTTLIRHLEAAGELVVPESARAVIREQAASGGVGVPWIDPRVYCELTVERDIANFDRLAGETRRIFFDRGMTDSYRANGVEPWPAFLEALSARRYNARVFVFPPWREIYETDAERRQDWAEAEATFDKIMQVFVEMRYEPVVVPTVDVATRAEFVLQLASQAFPQSAS
jgi:predicted ATPase